MPINNSFANLITTSNGTPVNLRPKRITKTLKKHPAIAKVNIELARAHLLKKCYYATSEIVTPLCRVLNNVYGENSAECSFS